MATISVNQGLTIVAVTKRLFYQASRTGMRLSLLLFEQGFYSIEVIRYLQAARYGFIILVIILGRRASPCGPSATRVFAIQKHSVWAN